MRTGYNESEHNEKKSQAYEDGETVKRKSTQISNIPPRASAYPSALAAVRPKYQRSMSDQQRITPFDGLTFNPVELSRSIPQSTDDLPEHVFHDTEDVVSIDELDTLPPDAPAQLRSRSQRSAYGPVSQVDTLPISSVQGKRAVNYAPTATRPLGELPHNLRQMAQLQGFSLERCVDNVRWWLLFPGRIEFLLWLVGAITLVCLTSSFFLVIVVVWMK